MVALGGLVEVAVRDLAEEWPSLLISSAVSVGLPAPSVPQSEATGRSLLAASKRPGASDQPSPAKLDRRDQVGLPPLCRAH
jgi:hypothetical protein